MTYGTLIVNEATLKSEETLLTLTLSLTRNL